MTAYTGTVDSPANQLGAVGDLTVVRASFTFSAATLVGADTFSVTNAFAQNGIDVPVDVQAFTAYTSTTGPASLTLSVGNSDDADGFLIDTGFTETGQVVRKGAGALIGTTITNADVTMTVGTDATAAYTGDIILEWLVKRGN